MTELESAVKKSAQWSTSDTNAQDNRILTKAVAVAVLVEAVLVIFAINTHLSVPVEKVERPVMQAELVQSIETPKPLPLPPPPPPPPPKIKPKIRKIINHHVPVITPAKPQAPAPISHDAPVIPVAQTPAPTAPSVATGPAVTPIAAAKPLVHSAPVPAVSIGIACPIQTQPEMPEIAESEGITGSVTARATISHGKVVQVDIIRSNPKGIFDQAVRQAMLHYQCKSNAEGDVVADQTFRFSLSD